MAGAETRLTAVLVRETHAAEAVTKGEATITFMGLASEGHLDVPAVGLGIAILLPWFLWRHAEDRAESVEEESRGNVLGCVDAGRSAADT